MLDVMHVMDCKGVAATIVGSILSLLITYPSIGPNQASRFEKLNQFASDWYDANPKNSRLPPFTKANITSDGWACLHGPTVKAAMTRQAAPLFAELTEKCCTTGSRADRLMIEVSALLVEFYILMQVAGFFFSPSELATFSTPVQSLATKMQKDGTCQTSKDT